MNEDQILELYNNLSQILGGTPYEAFRESIANRGDFITFTESLDRDMKMFATQKDKQTFIDQYYPIRGNQPKPTLGPVTSAPEDPLSLIPTIEDVERAEEYAPLDKLARQADAKAEGVINQVLGLKKQERQKQFVPGAPNLNLPDNITAEEEREIKAQLRKEELLSSEVPPNQFTEKEISEYMYPDGTADAYENINITERQHGKGLDEEGKFDPFKVSRNVMPEYLKVIRPKVRMTPDEVLSAKEIEGLSKEGLQVAKQYASEVQLLEAKQKRTELSTQLDYINAFQERHVPKETLEAYDIIAELTPKYESEEITEEELQFLQQAVEHVQGLPQDTKQKIQGWAEAQSRLSEQVQNIDKNYPAVAIVDKLNNELQRAKDENYARYPVALKSLLNVAKAGAELYPKLTEDLASTYDAVFGGLFGDEELQANTIRRANAFVQPGTMIDASIQKRPINERVADVEFEGLKYEIAFDENGKVTNIYDSYGSPAILSEEKISKIVDIAEDTGKFGESRKVFNNSAAFNAVTDGIRDLAITMALSKGLGTAVKGASGLSQRVREGVPIMFQYAGQMAAEGIRQGLTPDEALLYSGSHVLMEAGTEMIFPFIGKLTGSGTNIKRSLRSLIADPKKLKSLKRSELFDLAIKGPMGEAVEEGTAAILNPVVNQVVNSLTEEDLNTTPADWEEITTSMVLGLVIGALPGLIGGIAQSRQLGSDSYIAESVFSAIQPNNIEKAVETARSFGKPEYNKLASILQDTYNETKDVRDEEDTEDSKIKRVVAKFNEVKRRYDAEEALGTRSYETIKKEADDLKQAYNETANSILSTDEESTGVSEEPAEGTQAEDTSELSDIPEAEGEVVKPIFSDFDNTLFDPRTQQLTALGQEIKAKIAAGEDVTILTSRENTPENRELIANQLGISVDKIKLGLSPEGKAAELKDGAVFYDDNPDNVAAAQQRGNVEVVNTGDNINKTAETVDNIPQTEIDVVDSLQPTVNPLQDVADRRETELQNTPVGADITEAKKDLEGLRSSPEKEERNKDRIEALTTYVDLLEKSNNLADFVDRFAEYAKDNKVSDNLQLLVDSTFAAINNKYDAELEAINRQQTSAAAEITPSVNIEQETSKTEENLPSGKRTVTPVKKAELKPKDIVEIEGEDWKVEEVRKDGIKVSRRTGVGQSLAFNLVQPENITGRVTEVVINTIANNVKNAAKAAEKQRTTLASLTKTLQDVFGLPKAKADAVARVADRIVGTIATRTGKSKQSIYDLISFEIPSQEVYDELLKQARESNNDPTQIVGGEIRGALVDVEAARKTNSKVLGSLVAQDAQFVIYALTNPNVSTPLHELTHVFERYLFPEERATIIKWADSKVLAGNKLVEGWTSDTSEMFARGAEQWLRTGVAPIPELQPIFDKFREWLVEIYRSIRDLNVTPTREVIDIYRRMLGAEDVAGDSNLLTEEDRQADNFLDSVLPQFQIVGRQGAAELDRLEEATVRLDKLADAEQMERDGRHPAKIWLDTGWERSEVDGEWKYEIPDIQLADDFNLQEYKDSKFPSQRIGIDLITKSSPILDAYPALKEITVVFDKELSPTLDGGYVADTQEIIVNLNNTNDVNKLRKTLVHELQHAVQRLEGFSRGSSPERFHDLAAQELFDRPFEQLSEEEQNAAKGLADVYYARVGGEAEADNVVRRLDLPEDVRRYLPLENTEDERRPRQIQTFSDTQRRRDDTVRLGEGDGRNDGTGLPEGAGIREDARNIRDGFLAEDEGMQENQRPDRLSLQDMGNNRPQDDRENQRNRQDVSGQVQGFQVKPLPEELSEEINISYGDEEKYRQAVREAAQGARNISWERLVHSFGADVSTLRESIARRTILSDFVEHGFVDYTGRRVDSIVDLVDLFLIHRSPVVEKSHVVYLKDNKIVHTSAYTAGSVYYTLTPKGQNLYDTAVSVGANKIYLLHNHPSGTHTPSRPDIRMTETLYKSLYDLSGGDVSLEGHAVIDTDKFSIIRPDGTTSEHDYINKPEPLFETRINLGEGFGAIDNVLDISKTILHGENTAALIYITPSLDVAGYDYITSRDLTSNLPTLKSQGASGVVVITSNTEDYRHFNTAEYPFRVMDVIGVFDNEVVSGVKAMDFAPMTPNPYDVNINQLWEGTPQFQSAPRQGGPTKKEVLKSISDNREKAGGLSGQQLFDRRPQFFADLKIKPSDLQKALEGRIDQNPRRWVNVPQEVIDAIKAQGVKLKKVSEGFIRRIFSDPTLSIDSKIRFVNQENFEKQSLTKAEIALFARRYVPLITGTPQEKLNFYRGIADDLVKDYSILTKGAWPIWGEQAKDYLVEQFDALGDIEYINKVEALAGQAASQAASVLGSRAAQMKTGKDLLGQRLVELRREAFAKLDIPQTKTDGTTAVPREELTPAVAEVSVTETEAQKLWNRIKDTKFGKELLARMVKGPIKITKASLPKRQKGIDSLNRAKLLINEALTTGTPNVQFQGSPVDIGELGLMELAKASIDFADGDARIARDYFTVQLLDTRWKGDLSFEDRSDIADRLFDSIYRSPKFDSRLADVRKDLALEKAKQKQEALLTKVRLDPIDAFIQELMWSADSYGKARLRLSDEVDLSRYDEKGKSVLDLFTSQAEEVVDKLRKGEFTLNQANTELHKLTEGLQESIDELNLPIHTPRFEIDANRTAADGDKVRIGKDTYKFSQAEDPTDPGAWINTKTGRIAMGERRNEVENEFRKRSITQTSRRVDLETLTKKQVEDAYLNFRQRFAFEGKKLQDKLNPVEEFIHNIYGIDLTGRVKDRVFNQEYGKLFEPEVAAEIHQAMEDKTDNRPLADKISSITGLSNEESTRLANAWQDIFDQELAEEKRKILEKYSKSNKTIEKALEVVRSGTGDVNDLMMAFGEDYGFQSMSAFQSDKFRQLTDNFRNAVYNTDKAAALKEVEAFLLQNKKQSWATQAFDFYTDWRFGSMLNGLTTLFAPLVGNSVLAMEMLIDGMSLILGSVARGNTAGFVTLWKAWTAGLNGVVFKGLPDMLKIIRTGESPATPLDKDTRLEAAGLWYKIAVQQYKDLKIKDATFPARVRLAIASLPLLIMHRAHKFVTYYDAFSRGFTTPYSQVRKYYYDQLEGGKDFTNFASNLAKALGKTDDVENIIEREIQDKGLTGFKALAYKKLRQPELWNEFADQDLLARADAAARTYAFMGGATNSHVPGMVGYVTNTIVELTTPQNFQTARSRIFSSIGVLAKLTYIPFLQMTGRFMNATVAFTPYNVGKALISAAAQQSAKLPLSAKTKAVIEKVAEVTDPFSYSTGNLVGFAPRAYKGLEKTHMDAQQRTMLMMKGLVGTLLSIAPLFLLFDWDIEDDRDGKKTVIKLKNFKEEGSILVTGPGLGSYTETITALPGWEPNAVLRWENGKYVKLMSYDRHPVGVILAAAGWLTDKALLYETNKNLVQPSAVGLLSSFALQTAKAQSLFIVTGMVESMGVVNDTFMSMLEILTAKDKSDQEKTRASRAAKYLLDQQLRAHATMLSGGNLTQQITAINRAMDDMPQLRGDNAWGDVWANTFLMEHKYKDVKINQFGTPVYKKPAIASDFDHLSAYFVEPTDPNRSDLEKEVVGKPYLHYPTIFISDTYLNVGHSIPEAYTRDARDEAGKLVNNLFVWNKKNLYDSLSEPDEDGFVLPEMKKREKEVSVIQSMRELAAKQAKVEMIMKRYYDITGENLPKEEFETTSKRYVNAVGDNLIYLDTEKLKAYFEKKDIYIAKDKIVKQEMFHEGVK